MPKKREPRGHHSLLLAVLACLVGAPPTPVLSQEGGGVGDPARKSEIIREIARLMEDHYVLPDEAPTFADAIRSRDAAGAYDHLVDAGDFAEAVTADLVEITGDSHIRLQVIESSELGESTVSSLHHPVRFFRLGQTEHLGFRRLEWLPGNVAYLDLIRFYPLSEAREMVDAAIHFLSTASAVIMDLRDNGGGSGESLPYWCSFFLPYPSQLTSHYSRADDFLKEFWTMAGVGGGRLREVPLYLLTSKRTFSAAEMFAYDMQAHTRATLVGEPTGGGAHSVDLYPINDQLEIYISTSRAINPLTGGNWEGEGVIPDVEVPSEAALDTAVALATSAARESGERREEGLRAAIGEMELLLARAEEGYRSGEPERAHSALDSLFAVGIRAGLVNDFFLDVLAYNYYSTADKPILLAILRRRAELFPSSAAYEILGYAHWTFDDTGLAIESYRRALELDPDNRNAAKMLRRLLGG